MFPCDLDAALQYGKHRVQKANVHWCSIVVQQWLSSEVPRLSVWSDFQSLIEKHERTQAALVEPTHGRVPYRCRCVCSRFRL